MALFSQRLMKIRSSKGWTQAQLADTLGISTYTLHRYETNQTIPDMDKISEYAKALNVTAEWLSGESVPKKRRDSNILSEKSQMKAKPIDADYDQQSFSIRCPDCGRNVMLYKIPCPHCGEEIWNLAAVCPVCGLDPKANSETFGDWPSEIHATQKQQDKISKSLLKDTTPAKIDKKSQTGVFVGRTGSEYKTSLNSCTCVSFIRDQVPCKHIYRLAMELGLYSGDFRSGVPKTAYKKWSIPETIALYDRLTDTSKEYFLNNAYLFQGDGTIFDTSKYPDLISSGLIVPVPENSDLISRCVSFACNRRKADIQSLLDYMSVSYDPSLSKAELSALVSINHEKLPYKYFKINPCISLRKFMREIQPN